MKIATTYAAYFNAGSRISLSQHEGPFLINKGKLEDLPTILWVATILSILAHVIKHFPVDFIEVVSQTALISKKEIERKVVYHHSNVLYKSSQTHHPNQDTSVIRDIFRVENKSRKPPDDFSPSTGASNGSWGISFLLNRAISARPFSACSILPFTRSHLGDSGISL